MRNDQTIDLVVHQLFIQLLIVVHIHVFDRCGLRIDLRHRTACRKGVRAVGVADLFVGKILDRIQAGIAFCQQIDLDNALHGRSDVVERVVRVVERIRSVSCSQHIDQKHDPENDRSPLELFSFEQQDEKDQIESDQHSRDRDHDLQIEHAQAIQAENKSARNERAQDPFDPVRPLVQLIRAHPFFFFPYI